MEMAEGLLLGKNGHVEMLGIVHQGIDFMRSERRFLRRHKRLAGEVEDLLHVETEQIHLVSRQSPDLILHEIFGGNGTAADVILHASPLHAWPISNRNCRAGEAVPVGMK